MADQELVHVLDYILNRCDEASMDAVAAAVERRRRDLSKFSQSGLTDPTSWARNIAKSTGMSGGMGLDAVRNTVRDLVSGMLKKEAPELTDAQVQELLAAWVPDGKDRAQGGPALDADMMSSMVDQFVAYSTGAMDKAEDQALRKELGAWPERYWKALPAVVKAVVTEYLGEKLTEREFKIKLRTAIDLSAVKKV